MKELGTFWTLLAMLALFAGEALGQGGGHGSGKGQRGAAPGQIRCGHTGCFEIPRGCRGEMRRVGTDRTVVMHCNEHRPHGNNLH
jgi:hypothetical protein